MFASTILLIIGTIITLGFALIWLIFAATLCVSAFVAVYRSIPRPER
jgi:hypothetical protein